MVRRLFEELDEKPVADHSAWGIRMGMLPLVTELWTQQIGWHQCFALQDKPWGNARFVCDAIGQEYQFSERHDVAEPQPGDHATIRVQKVDAWAKGIQDWYREKGIEADIVVDGSNRLVRALAIPLIIEVLPEPPKSE